MRTGFLPFIFLSQIIVPAQAVSQSDPDVIISEILTGDIKIADNKDGIPVSYIIPVWDPVSGIIYEMEIRLELAGVSPNPFCPETSNSFVTTIDFSNYGINSTQPISQRIDYSSSDFHFLENPDEGREYYRTYYYVEGPFIKNYYLINF